MHKHRDQYRQPGQDAGLENNEPSDFFPEQDDSSEDVAATGESDGVQQPENDIEEALANALAEVAALKEELKNAKLRHAADMENFQKRLKREHELQLRFAAGKVLEDLLPTLDNLALALQFGNGEGPCKELWMGVSMTRKLLFDAVTRHGLLSVGKEGEAFNPEIHEAVGQEKKEGLEAGHVARVLQCGYKLEERLLRPARVMVSL